MAKPNRKTKTPDLPPFPWEASATVGGETHALARRALERAEVLEAEAIDLSAPDAKPVRTSQRVWRMAQPPVFKMMNRARAMALVEFADAVERAHASGGTSDPTGGGGGGGARAPSLAALSNLERLGRMDAALAGHNMRVPLGKAGTYRRQRAAVMSLSDLARHAAVDGLSVDAILRHLRAKPSEARREAVSLALQEMAHRLAVCCGYEGAAHAPNWMRNTRNSKL